MKLQPITANLRARHGFFTRNGGQSTGLFASLNCSLSGGDDHATVLHNRALVARHLGVTPENLLGAKQTHGTHVITATTAWAIGAGGEADALVSATPGIALGIVTADCAPVLFSNAAGNIIGAAHAGWRGAVAGILEATADAMRKLGASKISAVIGPCIHQESYEVAADMRDSVLAHNPNDAISFTPGRPARWLFDLPGYCATRLAAAGITATVTPHDTYADEANFFSYRRRTIRKEPCTGHQISVITL